MRPRESTPAPPVPRPRFDDNPVVTKELAAGVLAWSQQRPADALASLQRAAEAAKRAGTKVRALELERAATALATQVKAESENGVPAAEPAPKSSADEGELFVFDEPDPQRAKPSDDSLAAQALADLPDGLRDALLSAGTVTSIEATAEMLAPDMMVLLEGHVDIGVREHSCPIEDVQIARIPKSTQRSTRQARILRPAAPAEASLTIVAGPSGARLLAIHGDLSERLQTDAPEAAEELLRARDSAHALAGILRSPLGRRIDGKALTELRRLSRTVRVQPGSLVVSAGEKVRALIWVGAGALTLGEGHVPSGEILFARELLDEKPAPQTVRVGPAGALLQVADRAHTLEWLGNPTLRALLD